MNYLNLLYQQEKETMAAMDALSQDQSPEAKGRWIMLHEQLRTIRVKITTIEKIVG